MEIVNFAGLVATFVLALAGGAWVLRRLGYGWGKTIFGTLAFTVAALALETVIGSIGQRLGWTMLPVAWVGPPLVIYALICMKRSQPLGQHDGDTPTAAGPGPQP